MRKPILIVIPTVVLLAVGLSASGEVNVDNGVDESWTVEMNQESYWEDLLGPGAECTKYEDHDGWIPEGYELVVTKGSTEVRVYDPAPEGSFQALGPERESSNGDDHYEISWVMMCKSDPPVTTTTTTEPVATTTTTTTEPVATTTTTTTEPVATTTTTTTEPVTTTTTTTTEPVTTTTTTTTEPVTTTTTTTTEPVTTTTTTTTVPFET